MGAQMVVRVAKLCELALAEAANQYLVVSLRLLVHLELLRQELSIGF